MPNNFLPADSPFVPSWKMETNNELPEKSSSKISGKVLRLFVFGLFVFIILFSGYYIYSIFSPKRSVIRTLYIKGDEKCVSRVNEALVLLRDKVNIYYQRVEDDVTLIRCEKGGLLNDAGGRFKSNNSTEFIIYDSVYNHPSINWVAATIVHETCHVEQFKIFQANKDKYSKEEMETQKARNLEGECDTEVVNVLTELGAEQADIDYAKQSHR